MSNNKRTLKSILTFIITLLEEVVIFFYTQPLCRCRPNTVCPCPPDFSVTAIAFIPLLLINYLVISATLKLIFRLDSKFKIKKFIITNISKLNRNSTNQDKSVKIKSKKRTFSIWKIIFLSISALAILCSVFPLAIFVMFVMVMIGALGLVSIKNVTTSLLIWGLLSIPFLVPAILFLFRKKAEQNHRYYIIFTFIDLIIICWALGLLWIS